MMDFFAIMIDLVRCYHGISLYYVRLSHYDHSTSAFETLRSSAHSTLHDHLIDSIEVLYHVKRMETRHEIIVAYPEEIVDTQLHPVTVQLQQVYDGMLYADEDDHMYSRVSRIPVVELGFGTSMGSRTYVSLDGWSTYTIIFGLPYRLTPSPRLPIPAIAEPEPVSTHTVRSLGSRAPQGFQPRPIFHMTP
ncbi:hypothetical protein GOP47_0014530 [Adiantum capillus-veneris]|uniref:Uncharacterized protein n=1 Tax=Adiantum capillus-veneris TaxID=13818 RepID=A0A9D4ULZ1_ADICA|nr:hypothetical protein GOP47_0014530 [Adiantum capillus-veneris]